MYQMVDRANGRRMILLPSSARATHSQRAGLGAAPRERNGAKLVVSSGSFGTWDQCQGYASKAPTLCHDVLGLPSEDSKHRQSEATNREWEGATCVSPIGCMELDIGEESSRVQNVVPRGTI
jgi:hypothetical protein